MPLDLYRPVESTAARSGDDPAAVLWQHIGGSSARWRAINFKDMKRIFTPAQRCARILYGRRYRRSNRAKIRASYLAQRSRRIRQAKKYYQKNRKRIIAATRQWAVKNRARVKRNYRQWYLKNMVRQNACIREWQKNNPEKFSANQRRRMKKEVSRLSDYYIRQNLRLLGIRDPSPRQIENCRRRILAKRVHRFANLTVTTAALCKP